MTLFIYIIHVCCFFIGTFGSPFALQVSYLREQAKRETGPRLEGLVKLRVDMDRVQRCTE